MLQSPDFEKLFTVQTDASAVGLGAVLLQGELGEQRPVAFISQKLFPRESLEALFQPWTRNVWLLNGP